MSNNNKVTSHTMQSALNFVRLCFNNNKNTTLKKHKKHKQ